MVAALLLPALVLFGCGRQEHTTDAAALLTPRERLEMEAEASPDWVTALPEAQDAQQLFVIAAHEKTTAWVSMHEKDENGEWHMIMSTPGGYFSADGSTFKCGVLIPSSEIHLCLAEWSR